MTKQQKHLRLELSTPNFMPIGLSLPFWPKELRARDVTYIELAWSGRKLGGGGSELDVHL